jgi:hypothetical protein
MNTPTVALEITFGLVGVTVTVGAPLTGMYQHRQGHVHRADPPLVGTAFDVAGARALEGRELVAA